MTTSERVSKQAIFRLLFSSRVGTVKFIVIKSPFSIAGVGSIPTPTAPGAELLTVRNTSVLSAVHWKMMLESGCKLALNPKGVRPVESL